MQAVGEEVLRFAGFTLDLRRGCLRADDRDDGAASQELCGPEVPC